MGEHAAGHAALARRVAAGRASNQQRVGLWSQHFLVSAETRQAHEKVASYIVPAAGTHDCQELVTLHAERLAPHIDRVVPAEALGGEWPRQAVRLAGADVLNNGRHGLPCAHVVVGEAPLVADRR